MPGRINDGPRSDRVSNVVGTVSKGGSAGSDDLDKRVRVLDLIGVLGSGPVHALHTLAIGGSFDASLSGVDIVVDTVESTNNNHGRNTLRKDLHVVKLVDLARSHGVFVESAHRPTERTPRLSHPRVQSFLAHCDELLVGVLLVLRNGRRMWPLLII